MIILGIDPGIHRVGYGIVELTEDMVTSESPDYQLTGYGLIETDPKATYMSRLSQIRDDIKRISYEYMPDLIVIELLYFATNVSTAIKVAQARGVILESLSYLQQERLIEITPTQVKQLIYGSGKANKKVMQNAIKELFGLESIIKPDDVNDAIAIAIGGHKLYLKRSDIFASGMN